MQYIISFSKQSRFDKVRVIRHSNHHIYMVYHLLKQFWNYIPFQFSLLLTKRGNLTQNIKSGNEKLYHLKINDKPCVFLSLEPWCPSPIDRSSVNMTRPTVTVYINPRVNYPQWFTHCLSPHRRRSHRRSNCLHSPQWPASLGVDGWWAWPIAVWPLILRLVVCDYVGRCCTCCCERLRLYLVGEVTTWHHDVKLMELYTFVAQLLLI